MFEFEYIFKGCEKIVHDRIISDTQRRNNKLMTKTLKKFERLLLDEA